MSKMIKILHWNEIKSWHFYHKFVQKLHFNFLSFHSLNFKIMIFMLIHIKQHYNICIRFVIFVSSIATNIWINIPYSSLEHSSWPINEGKSFVRNEINIAWIWSWIVASPIFSPSRLIRRLATLKLNRISVWNKTYAKLPKTKYSKQWSSLLCIINSSR